MSLRLIAIRGVRQGDGHGRTLLALAENRVRELGRGEVVMHGNDDALGFYRSLGYSETEWDEEPTAPGLDKNRQTALGGVRCRLGRCLRRWAQHQHLDHILEQVALFRDVEPRIGHVGFRVAIETRAIGPLDPRRP